MEIKATKYSESVPPLDSLKETYVYQIAEKIARQVKPTRQETTYIINAINRQQVSPTALLLRGWLFDFTAIVNQPSQLSIF